MPSAQGESASPLLPADVPSKASNVPAAPLDFIDLPPEILLKIFSYLSPTDLCCMSQLHSSLHTLAFDGSLWQHLHPVRWVHGNRQFFFPPSFEQEELSHDLILENNISKQLLSVEGTVNANLRLARLVS